MAETLTGVKRITERNVENDEKDIIDSFVKNWKVITSVDPFRHESSQDYLGTILQNKNLAKSAHFQIPPTANTKSNEPKYFHTRNPLSHSVNYEAN